MKKAILLLVMLLLTSCGKSEPEIITRVVYLESEPEIITETVYETVTEYTPVQEGDRLVGRASAYCGCVECCGKCDCVTASGKTASPGDCACNWLPFGSVIEFEGKRYTVTDRGSSSRFGVIGRIDIYFDNHEDALVFGVQNGIIEIISIG